MLLFFQEILRFLSQCYLKFTVSRILLFQLNLFIFSSLWYQNEQLSSSCLADNKRSPGLLTLMKDPLQSIDAEALNAELLVDSPILDEVKGGMERLSSDNLE